MGCRVGLGVDVLAGGFGTGATLGTTVLVAGRGIAVTAATGVRAAKIAAAGVGVGGAHAAPRAMQIINANRRFTAASYADMLTLVTKQRIK